MFIIFSIDPFKTMTLTYYLNTLNCTHTPTNLGFVRFASKLPHKFTIETTSFLTECYH